MAVADELRASGAEVSFLGTRERVEAELVPAAGYEIDFLDVARHRPPQPAAGGAGRAARRSARSATARAVLRRRGADVVMGGGGFVAGPAGLAAALSRTPLVLTEADSHLGLANRLLAGRARAGLPRLPDRGPRGRPLPGHRPPGARGGARRRPRRGAAALRDRRRGALPAGHRRQPGRPLDQLRRGRGLRRARRAATSTCSTSPAGATTRSCASASPPPRTPSATRCSSTSPTSATSLAASDLVLGRSGGSIFELTAAGRPGGPGPLSATPPPTTRRANASWMARRRAPRRSSRDADLERRRCSPRSVGAARRPGAPRAR